MTDMLPHEIPRDVLTMLNVELRQARAGDWQLAPNADGVDVDFVEMLEETITEIERLHSIIQYLRTIPVKPSA